jgi:hypothetical protein
MKVFIKSIFFVTIIFSCKNENNKSNDQLKVFDLMKIPEAIDIKLSDLGFVNIEYIPLETKEESMLPDIDGLSLILGNHRIIADDNYFLLKYWNLILKFRSDGSFVGRIGTEGRGPHEYTVAHDIDVNPENFNIYLVSAWQKKFNVYSDKGDFIRSFQMPIYAPVQFRFVDGNILTYSDNLQGNIKNSFVLLDTNGLILKNFPNKYPFTKHNNSAYGFARENLFYRFNNQLFKKEVYSDTIFVYKNMDFRPSFVIEVGEKLINPKAREEYEGLEIAKKYVNPLNLFEFGDFVYYAFMYDFVLYGDSKLYGFLGSKETNFKAGINLEKGLINDLDGGPNIIPLTTKDDNTIVACIDAISLKSYVTSDAFKNSKPKYPEKKKEFEKIANNLKETDNPVLVLVSLKK